MTTSYWAYLAGPIRGQSFVQYRLENWTTDDGLPTEHGLGDPPDTRWLFCEWLQLEAWCARSAGACEYVVKEDLIEIQPILAPFHAPLNGASIAQGLRLRQRATYFWPLFAF